MFLVFHCHEKGVNIIVVGVNIVVAPLVLKHSVQFEQEQRKANRFLARLLAQGRN